MSGYKYYINPYAKYDEDLKNWEKTSSVGLQETVNNVVEKAGKFIDIFSLLQGISMDETVNSVESQIAALSTLRENVSTKLGGALDNLGNLKIKVSELKTEEDSLIAKEEELEDTENQNVPEKVKEISPPTLNYPNGYSRIVPNEPEYGNWQSKINILRSVVNSKNIGCQKVQSACDGFILLINNYNATIEDLNASISNLFEQAFGIENFDSLSIEEKEKLMEEIIKTLETEYYAIQSSYLTCPEEIDQTIAVLARFGIYDRLGYRYEDLYQYNEKLGIYQYNIDVIKDILRYSEELHFWDMLNAYTSGEKTWEESGLGYYNILEIEFLDTVFSNFSGNGEHSQAELLKNCQDICSKLYQNMKECAENYDENAERLALLNTSLYAARQYKKTIKYDNISKNPDFGEYSQPLISEDDERWQAMKDYYGGNIELAEKDFFKSYYAPIGKVMDGYNTTFLFENMSEEEQKAYTYLYNTKGIESATLYLEDMADAINRRVGIRDANEFIEWIAAGEPGVWDEFADRANSFGKGFKNGIISFTDGFHDLWDPSVVKEAFDYEDAAIIVLLQDEEIRNKIGEEKAVEILKMYGWGDKIGEESIPAILNAASNLLVPGSKLGDTVRTISKIGNSFESGLQENEALSPDLQNSMGEIFTDAVISEGSATALKKIFKSFPTETANEKMIKGVIIDGTKELLSQVSGSVLVDEELIDENALVTAIEIVAKNGLEKIPFSDDEKKVKKFTKDFIGSLCKEVKKNPEALLSQETYERIYLDTLAKDAYTMAGIG